MLNVAAQYRIRQAYYIEKKSQREIAREFGCSRNTVKKALEQEAPFEYRRQQPAPAPVLGPYKERLKELVEANRELPRKQRYTARKMYEVIRAEGYEGAESTVRYHVAQLCTVLVHQHPGLFTSHRDPAWSVFTQITSPFGNSFLANQGKICLKC